MKKTPLFLVLLVSLAVCACENPLMADILLRKIITFYSNGGSYVPPQTVFRNERISQPQDPVNGDSSFSGWFTYNGTFYKGWDFDDIPEGDMDLYACWTTDGIGNLNIWNFDIEGVGTFEYNEEEKNVTVTPKTGYIKVYSVVSVYYEGVKGTEYPKTPAAPIDLGTYRVTFFVKLLELTEDWYLELEAGMLIISKQTA